MIRPSSLVAALVFQRITDLADEVMLDLEQATAVRLVAGQQWVEI
jgi:hypothetical protein